jgi:hypothetical protein
VVYPEYVTVIQCDTDWPVLSGDERLDASAAKARTWARHTTSPTVVEVRGRVDARVVARAQTGRAAAAAVPAYFVLFACVSALATVVDIGCGARANRSSAIRRTNGLALSALRCALTVRTNLERGADLPARSAVVVVACVVHANQRTAIAAAEDLILRAGRGTGAIGAKLRGCADVSARPTVRIVRAGIRTVLGLADAERLPNPARRGARASRTHKCGVATMSTRAAIVIVTVDPSAVSGHVVWNAQSLAARTHRRASSGDASLTARAYRVAAAAVLRVNLRVEARAPTSCGPSTTAGSAARF